MPAEINRNKAEKIVGKLNAKKVVDPHQFALMDNWKRNEEKIFVKFTTNSIMQIHFKAILTLYCAMT